MVESTAMSSNESIMSQRTDVTSRLNINVRTVQLSHTTVLDTSNLTTDIALPGVGNLLRSTSASRPPI